MHFQPLVPALSRAALQEGSDFPPPEALLQAVWQHQRLLRDQLVTQDGQRLHVLHPGFLNVEAGPDFREAVIRVGDQAPVSGDVEIDPQPGDWVTHGHGNNPAYKNVVLHIVWDGRKTIGTGKPVAAIRGKLDSPLWELNELLSGESANVLPEHLRGKCSAPLSTLSRDQLMDVLREAAHGRWLLRVQQFRARARQAGWEQALWEGIFRALGYKQNQWPMQTLAESRAQWLHHTGDTLVCQSQLLGLGGLLVEDPGLLKGSAGSYLRNVWDHWWRERDGLEGITLPRIAWRMNNLRPANHPQRRLALAAHWLKTADFIGRLEHWLAASIEDADLEKSLHEILAVKHDEFWSWHYTFRSARQTRAQPLIGPPRITDLAVNVILPWLWTRARESGNQHFQDVAEHRFLAWGPSEDNSLLRLARQRLLGGSVMKKIPGAAAQQGLIQIVKSFCHHSNAVCEGCEFPRLLRQFMR